MNPKRRHRAIKWAQEGKVKKIDKEIMPFYPHPLKEIEKPKLAPHPRRIKRV